MPDRPLILLTGGDGGFGNFGDELILESWKDFYRPFQKTHSIFIVMKTPPSTTGDGFRYLPDHPSAFEKAHIPPARIRWVHYYGGGYLNAYWMEDKIWLCDYLQERGFDLKKVFFTGQGLGPFRPDQKNKMDRIFREAAWVGTREPGANRPGFHFSFDDSIVVYSNKEPTSLRHKPRLRPCVGFNWRAESYADLDGQRINGPLQLINRFCRNHRYDLAGLCLVENPTYSDQRLYRGICREMNLPVKILPKPVDYPDGCRRVGQLSALITCSYHGALLALYNGVPVVAIYNNAYYKQKFEGLGEIMETPMFRCRPVGDLSETLIEQALRDRNRENLDHLTRRLLQLQRRNREVRERIVFEIKG
jgi:polysaccharide pyruvyl transferase WcaK-like protein